MKSDWEYKFWDNYYDSCANMWRKDLNDPDPEIRRTAEYMVKAMEEAKLYEHTAVKDPFIKGHTVIVKHKRGEPRKLIWEEVRFNSLPWYKKLYWKIRNLL